MHKLISLALLVSCSTAVHQEASTQERAGIAVRGEIFVGSELESYLRYLQTLRSEQSFWTVRGFSPAELHRVLPREDEIHPWMRRYDLSAPPEGAAPPELTVVRPELGIVYNTAFPQGKNDGPMWAGRGATTALRGGVAARYGPISLVFAPVAFFAQNREFELHPNEREDSLRFGAWRHPTDIDLPQRFGDAPYARVDPGQSTVRLDLSALALGASTANQYWGPASDHAVLLGDNAAGFAHAFVGTSRPVNIVLASVHGRLVWGRLEQSEFSPMPAGSARFMSGLVAAISPRGLNGLEVGFARFFHDTWPITGIRLDHLSRPLEGFLKSNLGERDQEAPGNQLVSAFARWAIPASGLEIYGEYGREDHSYNVRHLVLEPDDIGAYLLGFRKAWLRSDGTLAAARGEVYSSETSHLALTDMARGQPPMYRHFRQRQGHTHRGQMLASAAGYGGGASVLALDFFHAGGRWALEWERTLRAFAGTYPETGVVDRESRDVIHSVRVEGELFRGRFDIAGGIGAAYNFNRNLREDGLNLNASFILRAALP